MKNKLQRFCNYFSKTVPLALQSLEENVGFFLVEFPISRIKQITCFRGHSSFFLLTKQAGSTPGQVFRSICCLLLCILQRISLFEGPSFCNLLKSKVDSREAARGDIPQCEGDRGSFSPVQCSQEQERCWCVFGNGEEVPGTRVNGTRLECASEFLLQASCEQIQA